MSKKAFRKVKHKWRSTSIRRRLILTLGIGAFALSAVIGVAVFLLLSRAESNLWASRQNDTARNAALVITSYIGQVSHSLDSLGMYEIAEVVEQNQDFLPAWLNDNPEFKEVILLKADGTVLGAAARGTPLLADPETAVESEWFEMAAAGIPMRSEINIALDNSPYITLARPTDNGGVVAARLQMGLLWEVIGDVHFGQSGMAYIVEKSTGMIVGHRDVSILLDRVCLEDWAGWKTISAADNFSWNGEYINFQGKEVLGRTQPIANSDWVIITEVALAEATETTRLAVGALGIGILGIDFIALLTSLYFMNSAIFNPLNDLRRRARRIAQGEFGQIKVGRIDELGEVAQAFNDMSQTLKERDARIANQTNLLSTEVAERKQAQEGLQQANTELIEASQYKDQFLATMSHELRTPLNAILGMSEALSVPVYGPLNPQQYKAVSHIQDSGRHLLGLIDDMLDLSKITAGRSPLDFSDVSMASLIDHSVKMVRPILNAKKLIFHNKCDPKVQSLMADSHRFKQIVVNLLNNACKFTPEGGHIGLDIRGETQRGILKIIVSDTGCGMPESQLKRIFDPFVQVDGAADRQHNGAGLGLTLVNRIVEMHGGNVIVESKVGKGSRFTVELPWRATRTRHAEPEECTVIGKIAPIKSLDNLDAAVVEVHSASQNRPNNQPSILIVEDREANIITLLDYLQVKGFEVLVARSGKESLVIAREQQPHIILMDIHMPEMSGIEAIGHLRASITTRTIPIIALTALAMPGDRERCLNAGANEYISKPISLRELLKTIEYQLKNNERSALRLKAAARRVREPAKLPTWQQALEETVSVL